MATTVRDNTKVAVEIEVTEGTYVAPSGASSFVQTLSDGFEMTPSKELLDRNVLNGSVGRSTPRTGTRSVSGSVPVEARAFSTEGDAPEYDKLLRAALGSRRQISAEVTTKASGNTGTVLAIENADIADFAVGDIILIKESGGYHVSPITAVDDTTDAAEITLLVPKASGSFSNSVVIAKATIYTVANSGHPSLSITKYVEDAVREVAKGCRVTSMSLESFSTGQLPTFNFGFEGLDFDRTLTAPSYSPSYDATLPPIVLDARAYVDGDEVMVNEVSFSLENSLGYKTAISESNGRASSRVTQRTITGTFNPYKEDDDLSNYNKFVNNTAFSLFAYAKNPTSTPGEFENIVAFYLPNCLITEMGEADQDGILQDALTFSADRGPAGTSNEIFIAII